MSASNGEFNRIRRYELKYAISESMAREIKDYISGICLLDANVPPGESGYYVNNFYFDTPDLRFYTDTKFKKPTRYKPRARFYGLRPEGYIWPEIKYRNASVIWKTRYSLPMSEWPDLFSTPQANGQAPVVKSHMDSFNEVVYWYAAEPVLHIRYFREPYVTQLEDYGRVTFDRELCCRPTHGSIELEYNEWDMEYYDNPVTSRCAEESVILEIKVERQVPYWAIELIRMFHLMQRGYSKYCYGIESFQNNKESGRIARY